jgi:chromatin remodeling complex protein RSC6
MTTPTTPPSKVKEFSLKVLEGFDELARPEIQNQVIAKLWDYIKNYARKVVMKKPDAELQIKLFKIHKTFKEHFDNVDMAIEIKKGEALGSPKIPNLGDMANIRKLTDMENKKALKLIEELGL